LQNLACLNLSDFDKRVLDCEIEVLCDVTNPLCGDLGAARIYGPQKGATSQQVEILDNALSHFADVVSTAQGHDLRDTPGAGAAGGTAFGLMSFCGAHLVPGIEAVLHVARFAEHLEHA
jgi:glycerate kinase